MQTLVDDADPFIANCGNQIKSTLIQTTRPIAHKHRCPQNTHTPTNT